MQISKIIVITIDTLSDNYYNITFTRTLTINREDKKMPNDKTTNINSKLKIPTYYKCSKCGATGIKLWRDNNPTAPTLLCFDCAEENQNEYIKAMDHDGKHADPTGVLEPTIYNIGILIPAIPNETDHTYFEMNSVPDKNFDLWKKLTNFINGEGRPFKFDFSKSEVPDNYSCDKCGATGVKLWRIKYQTNPLFCVHCLCEVTGLDINLVDEKGSFPDQDHDASPGERTENIGIDPRYRPAIPTRECDNFYGSGWEPEIACDWWRRLPLLIKLF